MNLSNVHTIPAQKAVQKRTAAQRHKTRVETYSECTSGTLGVSRMCRPMLFVCTAPSPGPILIKIDLFCSWNFNHDWT